MKLMIDIPKEEYERMKEQSVFGYMLGVWKQAIKNGTPLPDGAEILTKEAYSDLCRRTADVPDTNVVELISRQAAEQPEKRTEERTKTHACVCINRQAAIDAIGNVPDHDDGMVYEALSHAQRDVALLPPVTPQPKIGHWILKHRTHNAVKHYTGQDEMGETHTISVLERYEVNEPYCSECGKLAGDTSQDYCCSCGAKMEGADG